MTPQIFITTALTPALSLLPAEMESAEARALILAIAWHESHLAFRRQLGNGPARSYLHFEKVEIRRVLKHEASGTHAKALCLALDITPNYMAIHRAMEFHDVLSAGFGRLLLRTLPMRLPLASEPDESYRQYRAAWRPNPTTADLRKGQWPGHYRLAWQVIQGDT